jgi:hypothetical protein
MHEQVSRLHIPMDNVPFAQIIKSLQNFLIYPIHTLKYPRASLSVRYPLLFKNRSKLSPLQY